MKTIFFFASVFVIIFIGCETPYQAVGVQGGYSDIQIAENIFKVSFRGNNITKIERVSDFALLRCAELSEQKGYSYFIIINENSYSEKSSFSIPATTYGSATVIGNSVYGSTTTYGGQTYTLSAPSSINTIVCFKTKPDGFSYESKYIIPSIKSKYNFHAEKDTSDYFSRRIR